MYSLRTRMRDARREGPGQSLVEFAIALPLLLLLLLFGLDFGRAFLGWVNLNNTVRIAANYAAINPHAWDIGSTDPAKAEYIRQIKADSGGINCTLPDPLPDPAFPSGQEIGDPAKATVTCVFHPITPLIGNIVGASLNITASAAFPIRTGAIAGIPVATTTVTSTSTSSTTTSTSTTSTTTTTTTTAMCTVPNLSGPSAKAQKKWSDQGFTTNVIFNPLVPPNYVVKTQSPAAGGVLPCASTSVTVFP